VIIFAATWCGIYLSKGSRCRFKNSPRGRIWVALGNWIIKSRLAATTKIGAVDEFFQSKTGRSEANQARARTGGKVVANFDGKYCGRSGIDHPSGKVTTWNKAAETVARSAGGACLGKSYAEVFSRRALRGHSRDRRQRQGGESIEREIKLSLQDSCAAWC